jgi:hypothetical protein
MDVTPSGTDHLLYCVQTLDDICAQLLGEPEEAIRSIRRRGKLTPPEPSFPSAYGEAERDAVAERRIELLNKLKTRREALEQAAVVLRDLLEEVAKAPPLEEKLLSGDEPKSQNN